MLELDSNAKLKIVRKNIIREVTLYYAQHKTGITMQSLNRKYNVACKDLGGLQDLLEAMRMESVLRIDYAKDGAARSVLPIDATESKNTQDFSWF